MHAFSGAKTILMIIGLLLFATGASSSAQDIATPDADEFDPSVLMAIYPDGKNDGERFEAEVEPGESTELTAVIVNHGYDPLEIRVYTSNVIPKINGGLSLEKFDAQPTGTTVWMEFPTEEITLAPGEAITRSLVISVPDGTPPGQYVNAVAIETTTVAPESEGGAFDLFYSKVVSVYITVPGDLTADFSLGEPITRIVGFRSAVEIPVVNTGNVRIDLDGSFKLVDLSGEVIAEGNVSMSPIYAGQETFIQIPFGVLPPAGNYLIDYSFTDSTSQVTQSGEKVTFEVPEVDESVSQTVIFETVSIEPNSDPIVFANVAVEITSRQQSFGSTRLQLTVHRDGSLVEEFVLAENLSLPQGTTTVTQRYLPANNWEPGTYTFSLKLESTDGGQTTLILEEEDVATLEVP